MPSAKKSEAPKKSKMVAIILAILLGCYGVDCFYLGNVKRGVIRLVVSVVTCGIGGFIMMIIDVIGYAGGTAKGPDDSVIELE